MENLHFALSLSPSIKWHLTVALLTFLWPLELWCLILRVCSVLLLLGLLC